MAEFCPDCWNDINGLSDPPEAYVLSWGYELCEGCGQWKRVVVGRRKTLLGYFVHKLIRIIKTRR